MCGGQLSRKMALLRGVPCASYGEARDLAAQHEGAKIFFLAYKPDENDDIYIDDDKGPGPFLG